MDSYCGVEVPADCALPVQATFNALRGFTQTKRILSPVRVFESRRPSYVKATNIYSLAKEEAGRKEERRYLSVNKIDHSPRIVDF